MSGRPHRPCNVALAAALALLVQVGSAKSQTPAPDKNGIVLNYANLAAVPTTVDAAIGAEPGLQLFPPRAGLQGLGLLADTAATRSTLNGIALNPPADGRASASRSYQTSAPPNRIQFDVAPSSTFTPYIGLGLGGSDRISEPMHPLGFAADTTDGARSYEGVAGFAYTLDKGTKLDFGYRMSNTQRPNVPLASDVDSPSAERDRAAVLSLHYDLDLLK